MSQQICCSVGFTLLIVEHKELHNLARQAKETLIFAPFWYACIFVVTSGVRLPARFLAPGINKTDGQM